MGIEPFLLASTLKVIIAQRLVRKICDKCRYSYKVAANTFSRSLHNAAKYIEIGSTLYQGKGCSNCSHTGYRGRVAIFEIIEMNQELEALILTRPSALEIWDVAKKYGVESLFMDGLEKVKNGLTTIEELVRVAEPPEETKNIASTKMSQDGVVRKPLEKKENDRKKSTI